MSCSGIDDNDVRLRNTVYALFVELGRAPRVDEVAEVEHATVDAIEDGWRRLHAAHALVLDPSGRNGVSDATANEGVEEYDLPALVPSGVAFQVVGEHRDQATECTGFVNVEIEGSPLASPITLLMLGLTGLVGWGFFLAVRPLFRRVA